MAKGSCPAHGDELCFGKLAVFPPVRGCDGAWYATTKNWSSVSSTALTDDHTSHHTNTHTHTHTHRRSQYLPRRSWLAGWPDEVRILCCMGRWDHRRPALLAAVSVVCVLDHSLPAFRWVFAFASLRLLHGPHFFFIPSHHRFLSQVTPKWSQKRNLTAAIVSVCRWKHVRGGRKEGTWRAWPCPLDCEAELALTADSDPFFPHVPPEFHWDLLAFTPMNELFCLCSPHLPLEFPFRSRRPPEFPLKTSRGFSASEHAWPVITQQN